MSLFYSLAKEENETKRRRERKENRKRKREKIFFSRSFVARSTRSTPDEFKHVSANRTFFTQTITAGKQGE